MKRGRRLALLSVGLLWMLLSCGDQADRAASQQPANEQAGSALLAHAPADATNELLPAVPGFSAPEFNRRLEPLMAKADPQGDAWDMLAGRMAQQGANR